MNYTSLKQPIAEAVQRAIGRQFQITLDETRFTAPPSGDMGDISFACFEIAKSVKKNPVEVANELAKAIAPNEIIKEVRAVGPYLNFFIKDEALFESVVLRAREAGDMVGSSDVGKGETIVLEYLSPNTNKPLHIGHVRNACLGDSLARILESQGWNVERAQIINDRGAHICKSMLMYEKHGEGKEPKDKPYYSGIIELTSNNFGKERQDKSDHFVGKFYEMFEREVAENPKLQEEAQEMLRKWETGDKEVRELWKKLKKWVENEWDWTLKNLRVKNEEKKDDIVYESEIYEKGKEVVAQGLAKGVFYKRDDGAVEIDLTAEGLDKKVLLRADGTSIYITQDLYLAQLRAYKYPKASAFIYVVGKDQEYHFKVLFILLKKLGLDKKYHHLSYGMLRLKTGKMSSRMGTVVDADDLIDETTSLARAEIKKRDETLSEHEADERARAIGIAALKYYILHVDPSKDIVFDPAQAVRFEGATGPYIQYTYARVQSILKKILMRQPIGIVLNIEERGIINKLARFQSILEKSAQEYSPAHLAHYLYELAENINSFYHKHQVLKAEDAERDKRLALLDACATVLKKGLKLLGIDAVERM